VKKEAATFKMNLQKTCLWMQNLGKITWVRLQVLTVGVLLTVQLLWA